MSAPISGEDVIMFMRGPPHDEPTPESALDALLRAESAVAERVERARADAAALIATATADADAWSAQAAASLDLELAAMDAAQVHALSAIERDVAQSAAELVRRYRTVTDVETTRLARVVLADVTELALANTP